MKKPIEGKPLIVSASIGEEYARAITVLLRQLHLDTLTSLESCFSAYAQDSLPENGSLVAQIRMALNKHLKKYDRLFNLFAKRATERMIERVNKNASSTLKMSLKEMSKDYAVKVDFMSDTLRDITQANVLESVNLIKLIPQKFLTNVQTMVTESITTGKGFSDLKRGLIAHYQGNKRRAELTALDQTRKAYRSIQAERLQALGVKKFKWIHSGGGREPRVLHKKLNKQIFSFDDPPYIGTMYGQKVYGLPGHLPNCRCSISPVFEFEDAAKEANKEAAYLKDFLWLQHKIEKISTLTAGLKSRITP